MADILGVPVKFRGHGNGLSIALAALAVVIAGSGTAYAVTATVVNIADPTSPGRVARVDPAGRLSTVGAASTVNITGIASVNNRYGEIYSAPQTGTLAVTRFSVTPVLGSSYAYGVYLFQVPVNPDGACSTTTTTRTLGYALLRPGDPGVGEFTSPVVVAPVASKTPYCLNLYAYGTDPSTPAGDQLAMQLTAFVTAGTYASTAPAANAPGNAPADVPADAPAPQPKSAAVAGR